MKHILISIFLISIANSVECQYAYSSSIISICKTYSQNKKFYVKSIPFDDEHPSVRGKSFLYKTAGDKLMYTINRYFDFDDKHTHYLTISNDGENLAFILSNYANEKVDSLKSIVIYKKGKLIKSYTLTDITGCNPQIERCSLIYNNFESAVDKIKSNYGTIQFKAVVKDSLPNTDKFLFYYSVFTNNDTIYLTDPKKTVHIISLVTGNLIANIDFKNIYTRLESIKNKNFADVKTIDEPRPDSCEFPNLITGKKAGVALGELLDMKAITVNDKDFYKYKPYQIKINAYMNKEGKINILMLDVDKHLSYEKVKTFFESSHYDMRFLPAEIGNWYFKYFFYSYRNKSDSIASLETQALKNEAIIEREKRMSLDSIDGIYIPPNLEACFVQLDKQLDSVLKKEMIGLKNSGEMIKYHSNLGMWIRNYWGLWGGSRLLKYFNKFSLYEPDGLSSVILFNYYEWLRGNKNIAEYWEEKAKQSPKRENLFRSN